MLLFLSFVVAILSCSASPRLQILQKLKLTHFHFTLFLLCSNFFNYLKCVPSLLFSFPHSVVRTWPGKRGLANAPEAELKSHCMCSSDKAAKPHWRTVLDSFPLSRSLSDSHCQLSTWERKLDKDTQRMGVEGGEGEEQGEEEEEVEILSNGWSKLFAAALPVDMIFTRSRNSTVYTSQKRGSTYCVTERTPDNFSNPLLSENPLKAFSQSAASHTVMGTLRNP